MKVSVIIPIYKVEQYLDECLQSVFSQSYNDLEIILVDDGSPDRCPQLCDEYAQQDNRVKVIHKSNGGLSDARNAGLKIATGDYVIFLDSDDYWINDRLVELLVEETVTQKGIDIILFLRTDFSESTKQHHHGKEYDIAKIRGVNRTAVFEYLLKEQMFNLGAWLQMTRRNLLIDNSVFFEVGLLSEDVDWHLNMWQYIQTISVVNIHGYCYRHRENSITTTYSLKNFLSYDYMFSKWDKIVKEEKFDNELKQLYKGFLAYLFPTLLYNYFVVPASDRRKEYNLLKKWRKVLQYSMTPKSDRVKKVCNFTGFRLACWLFGLWGLRKKGFRQGLVLFFR